MEPHGTRAKRKATRSKSANFRDETPPAQTEPLPVGYIAPLLDAPQGEQDDAEDLPPMQALESGYGPQVESALLRELLTRSVAMAEGIVDPSEAHCYDNPLARVNSYKHRLQALRCECADVRLRALDAEERLNEARSQIEKLENNLQSLNLQLQQICASRAWKLAEKLSRFRKSLSRLLPRRR